MRKTSKFIVLDVVFYGNSLNYDQGSGNIQELKKITKWDGKQYTLVSRYALRYSILHHANSLFGDKWPLADDKVLSIKQQKVQSDEKNVVQPEGEPEKLVKEFPEFDLFGYMMTKGGESATTRSAVAALSHAVSLVPFNYDTHFNTNLDVAKRANKPKNINPFTREEHYSYYVYSIVIDLNRLGIIDDDKKTAVLEDDEKITRINQLVDVILTLKRQIKGEQEDLSPKILVAGLYNNMPYESFKDRIALADEYEEEITQNEEKVENGTKILRRTIKTNKPKFEIYGLKEPLKIDKVEIKGRIKDFLAKDEKTSSVLLYHVPEIKVSFESK
ncbi:MAG: type I-B CRISPR-associated protein Cas7/Cst2/DevR [Candidatus Nitrosotenuis sp.]